VYNKHTSGRCGLIQTSNELAELRNIKKDIVKKPYVDLAESGRVDSGRELL
jgi:hypothetical protein